MMKERRYAWLFLLGFLLLGQLLLTVYFGARKEGYHEDEYYTYYSTNRTAGLIVPDREWVERDTYRQEFIVGEEEGFQYGLVKQVQSWDVHPPLYYFLIHTVSSLFPGVFSKWIGLSVNMVGFAVSFLLLAWLSYMATGKNKGLTCLITAVNGFNAGIISGVMFIRMYEWLTVFILLCACLHVRAVLKENKGKATFYLPLMATVYLGFLTQYYYIIFHFFIGTGFCLWLLLKKKRIRECLEYGAVCAVGLLLAICSYPASLSHIFRGYRGTGAVTEFMDVKNTGERLQFFFRLMNDYLLDGWFFPLMGLLLLLALLMVCLRYRSQGKKTEAGTKYAETVNPIVWGMLLLGCLGYFFTISKTALLLFETSNRYQLPVYGIWLLLLIGGLYFAGRGCLNCLGAGKKLKAAAFLMLCLLFVSVDISELASGKVLFLYEEEARLIELAKENKETPVVVFYHETTPYHVWWCSAELLEHDRVYFMSEENRTPVTDQTIQNADKLLVYVAEGEEEEMLALLLESNPKLTDYRQVGEKSLFSVYLVE